MQTVANPCLPRQQHIFSQHNRSHVYVSPLARDFSALQGSLPPLPPARLREVWFPLETAALCLVCPDDRWVGAPGSPPTLCSGSLHTFGVSKNEHVCLRHTLNLFTPESWVHLSPVSKKPASSYSGFQYCCQPGHV